MSRTPILDFARAYAASGTARLHMPGHKGRQVIGPEALDITEIRGADALYEAEGIIRESGRSLSALFASGTTLLGAEGSSQCVKAMVHLAVTAGRGQVILAARNAHKSFLYACALTDASVEWLYPEASSSSVCACPVTPERLARALDGMETLPCAVYLTSPDYLGGMQDVAGAAKVCRARGVPLLIDNAHGAYLRFLTPSQHPMDLGADMCCDSAHKTLPALTGGALLHLRDPSPEAEDRARAAMAVYGSTSPSYLIALGAEAYRQYVAEASAMAEEAREQLRENGWEVLKSDPMRIVVRASAEHDGLYLAQALRRAGAECEYADRDHLCCMITWKNTREEVLLIPKALGRAGKAAPGRKMPVFRGEKAVSIRRALFARDELLPVQDAVGRICASPTVSCPPAVPVVCAGERITREAAELLMYAGVGTVRVMREQ